MTDSITPLNHSRLSLTFIYDDEAGASIGAVRCRPTGYEAFVHSGSIEPVPLGIYVHEDEARKAVLTAWRAGLA